MNTVPRHCRIVARSLVLSAVTLPATTCTASIAGVAESDPRVQMYRLLESEVMQEVAAKGAYSALRSSPCKDWEGGHILAHPDTARVASSKGYKEYALSTKCAVSIDTSCVDGRFFFPIDADGRWIWTSSRIAYVNYLRALASRSGVPSHVIGPALDKIDKIILANIQRRLGRPVRAQTFTGEVGQLGIDNDLQQEKNQQTFEIEQEIAHHWNRYLLTLPKSKIASLPSFEWDPGCGAGEKTYTVKFTPAGGTLWLINDFDWRVCKKRGIDPWGADCDGWSQLNGRTVYIGGKYRLLARWPGGATKMSAIDLSTKPDGIIEIRQDQ